MTYGVYIVKRIYIHMMPNIHIQYICTHLHTPTMVMRMMILWSARGHTLRCSDGLYGEYAHV